MLCYFFFKKNRLIKNGINVVQSLFKVDLSIDIYVKYFDIAHIKLLYNIGGIYEKWNLSVKSILDNMFPFSFKKSPMILTPFTYQSLINTYLHAIFILELYHTGILKTFLVFNELLIVFLV